LDGESWPVGPSIRDLEVVGEGVAASLLMGGNFNEANGQETDNIARYTNCDEPAGLVSEEHSDARLQVHLFPNPTTAGIHWSVRLERPSSISAVLVDAKGRRIESLFRRPIPDGNHRFQWDLDKHEATAGGVYFLRVEVEGSVVTRKVVLVP
jgi:hypothetical protein